MKKILLTLFFVALGIAAGVVSFRSFISVKEVEVPELAGLSPDDARAALGRRGLEFEVQGSEYSATVPQGLITSQSPASGQPVKQRETVQVVISRGPEGQSMPNILGKTIQEAGMILSKDELGITKVISVHSPSVPPGLIIAQTPQPDRDTGSPISVIVSAGPADVSYYCPDFRGMSPDEAGKLANSVGVNLAFTGVGNSVASQNPSPGARIEKGQNIELDLDYTGGGQWPR